MRQRGDKERVMVEFEHPGRMVVKCYDQRIGADSGGPSDDGINQTAVAAMDAVKYAPGQDG